MSTPDLWLHPFSAMHWSNGNLLRLTILGAEWPGRCFDCKMNNKSACFCFFGQHTKDGCYDKPLTPELTSRLHRIRSHMAMQSSYKTFCEEQKVLGVTDEEEILDAWDLVDLETKLKGEVLPLTIFPDQDVIIDIKSVHRASVQHYIPPVKNLLCQSKWSQYFSHETFSEFLTKRQEFVVGAKSRQFSWKEPLDQVDDRRQALAVMRTLPTDREKALRVSSILNTLYRQWVGNSICSETCRIHCCPKCKLVRRLFRKEYKDQVRTVVHKRFAQMFESREGPFSKFRSENFNGSVYEDKSCRVVCIQSMKD
jgi:hypothetical protein